MTLQRQRTTPATTLTRTSAPGTGAPAGTRWRTGAVAPRTVPSAACRLLPASSVGRARTGGFSLFELLIVVSLMGIVAAVAVPRYANSIGRYRAESAARRVAADLALAKAKARASSAPQTVTFNPAAGTYTISAMRSLDHPADPYTVDLSAEPYHVAITYASFGGAPQAQFDMFGSPLWDGTVTVRAGEYARSVQLSKSDGSVTVQ